MQPLTENIPPLHKPTSSQINSFYGWMIVSALFVLIEFILAFTDKSCATQHIPVSIQTFLIVKGVVGLILLLILNFAGDFTQMDIRTQRISPCVLFNVFTVKLENINKTAWTWTILLGLFGAIWNNIIGSITFWKWTDTDECNPVVIYYMIYVLWVNYIILVWSILDLRGCTLSEKEIEMEKMGITE